VTTPSPEPDSIESLVDRLRHKVAERRRAGEYPDRLVEDLDAHFERIAAHRYPAYDFDVLRAKLGALDAAGAFDPNAISYETRLPGGSLIHRLLGKVVRRQTEGILAQAQRHADALKDALWEVVAALETPAAHSHVDLVGEIEAIYEKLAVYERTHGHTTVEGLTQRVEALESHAVDDFQPWYRSDRFESRFRGDSDELRMRYRDLAQAFKDIRGPIVDIGCGRGEFVELLLTLDLDARGIEVDSELVRSCIERGLPVEFGEAVAWLGTTADEGLGGLALIQVVEHLTPQGLVDFVQLAARKVRQGGKVVVETVNPQSLYTFAHAFYLDPTHKAPVHPGYLMFLFEEAGFSHVELQWRSPCRADDRLQPVDTAGDARLASMTETLNANVDRVNRLLFAEQDYALIAIR